MLLMPMVVHAIKTRHFDSDETVTIVGVPQGDIDICLCIVILYIKSTQLRYSCRWSSMQKKPDLPIQIQIQLKLSQPVTVVCLLQASTIFVMTYDIFLIWKIS